MVDIYGNPYAQDVGQFGADNSNVERYKQAAEYAKDAEDAAKRAVTGIDEIIDLQNVTKQLQDKTDQQEQQFQQTTVQLNDQILAVVGLNSQTVAAADTANLAAQGAEQAKLDAEAAADLVKNMEAKAHTVDATKPAEVVVTTDTTDPTKPKLVVDFGIPKGESGKLEDALNVPDIDPALVGPNTSIVIADKQGGHAYTTSMDTIAKIVSIPSINGKNGPIVLDKTWVGLDNVENVASYSKTEADAKLKASADGYIKLYENNDELMADIPNRSNGEIVGNIRIKPGTNPLDANEAFWQWWQVSEDPTTHVKSAIQLQEQKYVRSINGSPPDGKTGDVAFTLPSGDAQLWIGEMVMFPHDPSLPYLKKNPYPGVLRADGSDYTIGGNMNSGKLDSPYAGLIASFQAGNVAHVTFAEWDAGARTVFAWDGDATPTGKFRVPDLTQGTVLRSPHFDDLNTPTEQSQEVEGHIYDQIPYVATVNGVVPDDDGNVIVSPDDIGAMGFYSFDIPTATPLESYDLVTRNQIYSVSSIYPDQPAGIGANQSCKGILTNFYSGIGAPGSSDVVQNLYSYNGTLYTRTGSVNKSTQAITWNNVSVNGGDASGWTNFSTSGFAKVTSLGKNSDITELAASNFVPLKTTQGGVGRLWNAKDPTTTQAVREDLLITAVATMNIGTTAGTVAAGDDRRFPAAGDTGTTWTRGDDVRIFNFKTADNTTGIQTLSGDLIVKTDTTSGTDPSNSGKVEANSFKAVTRATNGTLDTSRSIETKVESGTIAVGSAVGAVTFNYGTDNTSIGVEAGTNNKISGLAFTHPNNIKMEYQADGQLVSAIDLSDSGVIADGSILGTAFVTKDYVIDKITDAIGSGGGTGGGTPPDYQTYKDKVDALDTLVRDPVDGLATKAGQADLVTERGRIDGLASDKLDATVAESTYGKLTDLAQFETAFFALRARVKAAEGKLSPPIVVDPTDASETYTPLFGGTAPTP